MIGARKCSLEKRLNSLVSPQQVSCKRTSRELRSAHACFQWKKQKPEIQIRILSSKEAEYYFICSEGIKEYSAVLLDKISCDMKCC